MLIYCIGFLRGFSLGLVKCMSFVFGVEVGVLYVWWDEVKSLVFDEGFYVECVMCCLYFVNKFV